MALNELLWLFFAFGVGYSIAWFWKRLGDLSERWEMLLCLFLVPFILSMQFIAGAMVQSAQDLLMSLGIYCFYKPSSSQSHIS